MGEEDRVYQPTVDDIHVDVVVRECLVVFRFLGGCCLVGLFMTHRDNTNIHLYFMRMKEELKKKDHPWIGY